MRSRRPHRKLRSAAYDTRGDAVQSFVDVSVRGSGEEGRVCDLERGWSR